MSLLDRPSHKVVVTPQVKEPNRYGGNDLVDGDPVTVRCNVQTVSVEEIQALGGNVALTTYRCIGRGPWPGGHKSMVKWDGREWSQLGEARKYSQSRRTRHFDAIIQARTAEVK